MIETSTEQWNIPSGSGGSTTIKSEMNKRGLEPATKKAMTAAASALMNHPGQGISKSFNTLDKGLSADLHQADG